MKIVNKKNSRLTIGVDFWGLVERIYQINNLMYKKMSFRNSAFG